MNSLDRQRYQPPRLLLGMALLFCGWMVSHPFLFLIAAVAVESPRWTSRRFEFSDQSFARAWQLGWVAGAVVFFAMWLNDVSYTRIVRFGGLLPLFLTPMLLTESYSKAGSTPLASFSFIARRKRRADLAAGRPVENRRVTIAYPYLSIVLVSAGMNDSSRAYFLGVSVIVAIALWVQIRHRLRRWKALAVFLLITSVLAAGSARTIHDMRRLLRSGDQLALMYGRQLSPKFHQTGVGRIHHLKQSKRVIWYVDVEAGQQPQLLRETTYSSYRRGMWRNPGDLNFRNLVSLPNKQWSWGIPKDEVGELLPTDLGNSSRLRIRGDVDRASVLALPNDTTRLDQLVTFEVSVNQFGCVQLDEPSQTVVNFTAEHGSHRGIESAPNEWDLEIPEGEAIGIKQFVDQHGLRDLPLEELITSLKLLFIKDFTYSLDIRQEFVSEGDGVRERGLSYFLNESQVGYCEYFAGATALILRECGYPSRYAVGFSVAEQDSNGTFLLRGVHAHAWARVYADGTWQDLDLTPPDWLTEDNQQSWLQGVIDRFYDLRQRVTLWRLQGDNTSMVNLILFSVIGLMVLGVGARIWWLHRRGLLRSSIGPGARRGRRIPELKKVEPFLNKRIGPRLHGQPVGAWLRQLLRYCPQASSEIEGLAIQYDRSKFDPSVEIDTSSLNQAVLKLRAALKHWEKSKQAGES